MNFQNSLIFLNMSKIISVATVLIFIFSEKLHLLELGTLFVIRHCSITELNGLLQSNFHTTKLEKLKI